MTSSASSISINIDNTCDTLDYFDWHQMVFSGMFIRYIEHNGQFTIIMTILILQWHYTLELRSITMAWRVIWINICVCMQIIINWTDFMLHWNVPLGSNWLLDNCQPILRRFLLQRDNGNENRICWYIKEAPIFPFLNASNCCA